MLLTNPIGPAPAKWVDDRHPSRETRRDHGVDRSKYGQVAAEVAGTPAEAGGDNKAVPPKDRSLATPWQQESFGFADFLDIINPLQHIPIVATLYRKMSGDEIAIAPRVIGGALWGRLGGFVAGAVNALSVWLTGKDIGDHVYAALFESSPATTAGPAYADAQAPNRLPSRTNAEESSGALAPVEPTADLQQGFHYGHGEIDDDPLPAQMLGVTESAPERDPRIPRWHATYGDAARAPKHSFHATV